MADLNEEEFEDSEEDDDYVPGEEESDEDISDPEPEEELEQDDPARVHANGTTKKKLKKKRSRRGIGSVFTEEADDNKLDSTEKETKPEDEKKKADSLWADFLIDVTPPPKSKSVPKETENQTTVTPETKQQKPSSSKVKVTELFEFAGETVEVVKEVDATSEEAKKLLNNASPKTPSTNNTSSPIGVKRSGGVENLLGKLSAKKNRLSTLEKSKLDWNTYKMEEGIEEDLKVHNKGKDGYLEKIDFLQRTDLRQFEVEKSLRLGSRTNRS